nr:MAG TPA: hypothetical protein [Caudoviricetes sp.]
MQRIWFKLLPALRGLFCVRIMCKPINSTKG